MAIQNRIKELRQEQHKTLREVAEAVDTSNQNISNWERGKSEPKLATWQKLADFFEVSVAYLQGLTNIKNTHNNEYLGETAEQAAENLFQYVHEVGVDKFREEMSVNAAHSDSRRLSDFLHLFQEQKQEDYEKDFDLNQEISSLQDRAMIMEIIDSVITLAELNLDNSSKAIEKINSLTRALLTNIVLSEAQSHGYKAEDTNKQAKENLKILLKD